MPKDVGYHEAAVFYNESVAKHAEDLAEEIPVEEVAGWCRGLARFHRFHAEKHKNALALLNDPNYQVEKKAKNKRRRNAKKTQVVTEDVSGHEPAGVEERAVIEVAPGITRPMTEEEKASRAALLSNNEEAVNG